MFEYIAIVGIALALGLIAKKLHSRWIRRKDEARRQAFNEAAEQSEDVEEMKEHLDNDSRVYAPRRQQERN